MAFTAFACSATALLLVCLWLLNFNGGFAWEKRRMFNYHPLLMVLAWGVLTVQAVLSYRVLPSSHSHAKLYHAAMHSATLACAALGLYAVVRYHQLNHFEHWSDTATHTGDPHLTLSHPSPLTQSVSLSLLPCCAALCVMSRL
jgi:hypothetical protein